MSVKAGLMYSQNKYSTTASTIISAKPAMKYTPKPNTMNGLNLDASWNGTPKATSQIYGKSLFPGYFNAIRKTKILLPPKSKRQWILL